MPTAELSLQIEGMTCGSCVSHVDKALRSVAGVTNAAVNLATNTATVQGSPQQSELLAAVEHAGYKARILQNLSAKTLREIEARGQSEENALRKRLTLGFLFGIPAIAVEMMIHHQPFLETHFYLGLHEGHNILAFLLATAVILTTGLPFFTRGLKSALHKNPTMDTLVALGAGTAYIASILSLILWLPYDHAGHFSQPAISEFHAAVAIILLVTLGKYLEARAKKRASSAVANLANQSAPTAVRIAPGGALETIPAEQIQIGDTLQILAHQQLPVDGHLLEGTGSLDLSIITGESLPIELSAPPPPKKSPLSLNVLTSPLESRNPKPEALLPGGSTLTNGRITIRAASTAATSTVARILTLVNNAQAGKTQIQALADKVAAVFVPLVLLLALLNFAAHLLLGLGWQSGLLTTIATIIIACPCAMGLATPTAITVAMGRAAKLGILFTQASALESGRNITTVVFDKTGTLTTGKPHLTETLGVSYDDTPAAATHPELTPAGQHALTLAASLEQYSEHPLAISLVEAAKKFNLPVPTPRNFSSLPGGGVTATINDRTYALGSPNFIQSLTPDLSPVAPDIERLKNDGKTLVLLADTTTPRLLGLFAFQDTLRPDARETIRLLRDRGLKVGVLSGDSELAVRGAIQNIAVDFLKSNIQPAQKAAEVTALKSAIGNVGRKKSAINHGVAFIGDGINDAPALAAADLGIAMASATNIAKSAGDVLLMSDRLAAIPPIFALSRRTLRIIKQNLFWAFAYNVAAIPLAMLGILPPSAAAAAMILSSLSVVANALRLHRVKL